MMPQKTHFAFVRNLQKTGGSNLKSFADISSAESHAKRLDKTSKERQVEGRSHAANYFWSKAGDGLEGGGADYGKAYRTHKKQFGIKSERKGAALGIHVLVGVTPEWLAEGGDPRDLNNDRVKALIQEAKAWAESWMGEGAVWGVRYDTDEEGSGVVDILASPVRPAYHKSGKTRPSISVRKANIELQEKNEVTNGWAAQQTDWAKWAQRTLDSKLQRGKPKKQTDRENVSPEAYAAGHAAGHEEGLRAAESSIQAEIARRWAETTEMALNDAQRAEETAWGRIKSVLNFHVDQRADERLKKAEIQAASKLRETLHLKKSLATLWRVIEDGLSPEGFAKVQKQFDEQITKEDQPFKLQKHNGPSL